MRKERMTLRKWYGGSMRLPYLGTFAASNFLVSTVGLVRSICLNRLDIMPRIKFQRGSTIYPTEGQSPFKTLPVRLLVLL